MKRRPSKRSRVFQGDGDGAVDPDKERVNKRAKRSRRRRVRKKRPHERPHGHDENLRKLEDERKKNDELLEKLEDLERKEEDRLKKEKEDRLKKEKEDRLKKEKEDRLKKEKEDRLKKEEEERKQLVADLRRSRILIVAERVLLDVLNPDPMSLGDMISQMEPLLQSGDGPVSQMELRGFIAKSIGDVKGAFMYCRKGNLQPGFMSYKKLERSFPIYRIQREIRTNGRKKCFVCGLTSVFCCGTCRGISYCSMICCTKDRAFHNVLCKKRLICAQYKNEVLKNCVFTSIKEGDNASVIQNILLERYRVDYFGLFPVPYDADNIPVWLDNVDERKGTIIPHGKVKNFLTGHVESKKEEFRIIDQAFMRLHSKTREEYEEAILRIQEDYYILLLSNPDLSVVKDIEKIIMRLLTSIIALKIKVGKSLKHKKKIGGDVIDKSSEKTNKLRKERIHKLFGEIKSLFKTSRTLSSVEIKNQVIVKRAEVSTVSGAVRKEYEKVLDEEVAVIRHTREKNFHASICGRNFFFAVGKNLRTYSRGKGVTESHWNLLGIELKANEDRNVIINTCSCLGRGKYGMAMYCHHVGAAVRKLRTAQDPFLRFYKGGRKNKRKSHINEEDSFEEDRC